MPENKYTYVKFLTNVPESMTFKFDEGLEKEGKFGKYFNWGVTWKGEDAYMSASPLLNDLLLKIGKLYGKTVQILKYEDGNKKMWKILDMEGNTISGGNTLESVENSPQAKNEPKYSNPQEIDKLIASMEAMRIWATGINAEIKTLREKVSGLETLSVDLNGKEAVDFHTSFPTDSPLGNEYEDIPTVK